MERMPLGRPPGSKNKPKAGSSIEKFLEGDTAMAKTIDKVLKEIEELRKQFSVRMDKMEGEMRENRNTYLNEIMTLRKEMEEERKIRDTREEEFRKEREEWKEEKKEMNDRIKSLEMSNEKSDRERRKKNIVISGVTFNETNCKGESSEFLKEKLNIDVCVKRAHSIKTKNSSLTIISLESWEQKMEVMKKKKELERGIYVEDDLTQKEREIQKWLRDIAKEERNKGKDARVGYMKLYIDGRCKRYNEKTEKLEEVPTRGY